MDWKKYLGVIGAVALLFCAADAHARGVLYEDPETGQLFTKPGEGRVAVDAEVIINGGAVPAEAPRAPEVTEDGVVDKVMSKLPSWVQKTKIHGDLRLRYDFMDTEGKEIRHRGRYSAKINLEFPVNDWFSAHFQLASDDGKNDPKSANRTFGNSYEAPDIRLRQAYAQLDVLNGLTVRAGQINNVLWRPSDGIWDKDINPTGIGASYKFKNESMAEPFMNAALYVMDESQGNSRDPYVFILQPGVKLKLSESVQAEVAAAYYGYQDVKYTKLDFTPGSNTKYPVTGVLKYDYDGIVASAQVDIKTPVELVPYTGLFGEYAYNFDPDRDNQGYIAGIKLGHKKVKKGLWQASYSWRRMERDAILDILPDSDFFEGKTGVTGHEFILTYGLFEKVDLGLDYYRSRDITTNIDENRAQVDVTFKF